MIWLKAALILILTPIYLCGVGGRERKRDTHRHTVCEERNISECQLPGCGISHI